MVSLGPNITTNRQGAQYMDGNTSAGGAAIISSRISNTSGNESQVLLDPVLGANTDGTFKPLKTVPLFSAHLVISTVISLVGIVLAAGWPDEKRCEAYFIMLYLRASFWVITFLFDHIIKKHHDDLRMNGYHDFHRATAMQKGVPLNVVSLWNSTLLAVQALIHHFYGPNFWQHCMEGFFSPISYVTAFNLAETVVLTASHSFYIAKVRNFNKAKLPPDALRGTDNVGGSIGLMQPSGDVADLLSKQADLIVYLKDHNLKLNQKLHQMQLNARTINISN